jgi:hypothetical protein
MSRYCYNGNSARRIIGCDRESFRYLVSRGAFRIRRTENGGYLIWKYEVDNFNLLEFLIEDNRRLFQERDYESLEQNLKLIKIAAVTA